MARSWSVSTKLQPSSAGPSALLTADLGNSTLDLLFHASGRRERLPGEGFGEALAQLLHEHPVQQAVVLSVRASGGEVLQARLRAANVRTRVVGRELPCRVPLDYLTPQTLGADRWVGAMAAHAAFGRAVVVDCGSATTVNLIEADGTFRGGPIAPGLAAWLAGMLATTPALPSPDLDCAPSFPPRSSQAAVNAGVAIGYCGMVERLVQAMLAAAAGPATVVVTGGRAPLLLAHTRLRPVFVPDLVHRGLLALADEP